MQVQAIQLVRTTELTSVAYCDNIMIQGTQTNLRWVPFTQRQGSKANSSSRLSMLTERMYVFLKVVARAKRTRTILTKSFPRLSLRFCFHVLFYSILSFLYFAGLSLFGRGKHCQILLLDECGQCHVPLRLEANVPGQTVGGGFPGHHTSDRIDVGNIDLHRCMVLCLHESIRPAAFAGHVQVHILSALVLHIVQWC
jgi:hypothetical protein